MLAAWRRSVRSFDSYGPTWLAERNRLIGDDLRGRRLPKLPAPYGAIYSARLTHFRAILSTRRLIYEHENVITFRM